MQRKLSLLAMSRQIALVGEGVTFARSAAHGAATFSHCFRQKQNHVLADSGNLSSLI